MHLYPRVRGGRTAKPLSPHRRVYAAVMIAAILATQGTTQAAITFMFDFADPAGTGWNDPTYGLERRTALINAADTLGSHFTANATIGFTVTSTNDSKSSTLASAGSAAYKTNEPGFQPTLVQYKIQSNYNGKVSYKDGSINWNFADPCSYSSTTSGVGSNQYDFVSTTMHELLHAFGFISAIDPD